MDIQNQVAVVTGGGSGMGAATARQLASQGAKVAVLDLNEEKANAVAAEIKGKAYSVNVADAETVEAAMASIANDLGAIRVCVNCAGIAVGKRVVGKEGPMALQDFANVINVNLLGTFNVMRLAAHAMTLAEPLNDSGERGVIINTASVAAYEGQIGQTAYSASKSGIVGLTVPAARELARFGVRVMTIAPGLIKTPLLEALPDSVQVDLAETVPFPHRLGTTNEFATLVSHIVENSYLNGETIRLDGALRMQS